jgi:nitroreductase/dihydropteridine reductase
MSLIKPLQWRNAIKNFDHTKKVSPELLDELLTAIQLSPSSAGLQNYKVLVVENPEIREKLREAAHGQAQLTQASHVIVFNSAFLCIEINMYNSKSGVIPFGPFKIIS